MSHFKLIAITPLKDCSDKFSKKLTPGKAYQLYSDYDILLSYDGMQVEKAEKKQGAPKASIYTLPNEIIVNISAVVGKNGEGKSTLFELFYRAIYLMATTGSFYPEKLINSALGDLKWRQEEAKRFLATLVKAFSYLPETKYVNIKGAMAYDLHFKSKDVFLTEMVSKYGLSIDYTQIKKMESLVEAVASKLSEKIIELNKDVDLETEREKLLKSEFNVSFIYERDGSIFEMVCSKGIISHFIFGENGIKSSYKENAFDLEDFFYSISLNYSHHGLNSSTIGQWIIRLFHKNDGYRTPIVLNPMRDYGNYDINHEIKLSNERLMATLAYDLLHDSKSKILGKYVISKFIFSRKGTSYASEGDNNPIRLHAMEILDKAYKIDARKLDLPYTEAAINYLTNKIPKIAENYQFLIKNPSPAPKVIINFLKKDNTHVSKKIRQVVNYLSLKKRDLNPNWLTSWALEKNEISLNSDEFLVFLRQFSSRRIAKMNPEELIEFALPGFFNVDFEFTVNGGTPIKLSEMSSGEQQSIFNNNTILYHLYNLQSVHQASMGSKLKSGIDRPAYKYINLILDEMEMYYHPEMQRHFIEELMAIFGKLDKNRGIRGINVAVLTHSPFVLSDIPVGNILRLGSNIDQSAKNQTQTFAANIHDLLRREFLLEKGFIGEFARKKIDQVIDSLQAHRLQDSSIHNIKKSSQLLDKEECSQIIELIGEPVLYRSLIELYLEVFPNEKDDFLQKQIDFLQKMKAMGAPIIKS